MLSHCFLLLFPQFIIWHSFFYIYFVLQMNSSNNLTQTHINSRKSRSRSSSLVRSRSRTTPPSSPPPGGPSLLAKLTLPASTTTTTTTTTTPAKLAPQQQQPIYYSITAEQLIQTLSTNQYTLILDIRTQSQFSQSHLRHSVNLNLPTTLLKRPLYGPDRYVNLSHESIT
jgi:cytoskeletal protein RodZ